MANEMAAMPAKSREIPTHTTTIVVPNTSGWIKTHSEQSNSRMPLMMVHADPGTFIELMSPPRPMALNPRNISQKPRKIGSRKRYIPNEDRPEHDFNNAAGQHPAASCNVVFVGSRKDDLEDARE